MTHRRLLVAPLLLALGGFAPGSTLSVAQAQPDPGVAPKAANPPAAQPGQLPVVGGPLMGPLLRGPLGAIPGQPMIQGLRMAGDPAQMMEQSLRMQLTQGGFTDKALQDAVVEFARARDKARQPLRDKWNKINEAMRGNAVTDKQLAILLDEFKAAVEDEKTRNEDALKALDGKIGYSKKPRLEALLMTLDLIGDQAGMFGGNPLGMPFNNMVVGPWGGIMPGGPNFGGGPGFGGGGQVFINPGGGQVWQFDNNGNGLFMQPVPPGAGGAPVQPFVFGLPPGVQPNARGFQALPGDVLPPPAVAGQGFVVQPPRAFRYQWHQQNGQPPQFQIEPLPAPALEGAPQAAPQAPTAPVAPVAPAAPPKPEEAR